MLLQRGRHCSRLEQFLGFHHELFEFPLQQTPRSAAVERRGRDHGSRPGHTSIRPS